MGDRGHGAVRRRLLLLLPRVLLMAGGCKKLVHHNSESASHHNFPSLHAWRCTARCSHTARAQAVAQCS